MTEWEIVVNAERGHIFCDFMVGVVRCIVRRGGGSLCAYVGLSIDHILSGLPYESYDNSVYMDLDCHGGLTFSGEFEEKLPGYWFYGWDYAHLDDYATYYAETDHLDVFRNDHKWTVPEVTEEVQQVAKQLQDMAVGAELALHKINYTKPEEILISLEPEDGVIRRINVDE